MKGTCQKELMESNSSTGVMKAVKLEKSYQKIWLTEAGGSIIFKLILYKFRGRGDRTRTCNQRFWRPLLYQLSYTPMYMVDNSAHYNESAFQIQRRNLLGWVFCFVRAIRDYRKRGQPPLYRHFELITIVRCSSGRSTCVARWPQSPKQKLSPLGSVSASCAPTRGGWTNDFCLF